MLTLNKKGWEMFDKWQSIYEEELKRLREEMNDPDYTEGWCIIDNYNHVKTLEDEVGLLIFGYDEHIDSYFDEWRGVWEDGFFRDAFGKEYTLAEVEQACMPFYEKGETE